MPRCRTLTAGFKLRGSRCYRLLVENLVIGRVIPQKEYFCEVESKLQPLVILPRQSSILHAGVGLSAPTCSTQLQKIAQQLNQETLVPRVPEDHRELILGTYIRHALPGLPKSSSFLQQQMPDESRAYLDIHKVTHCVLYDTTRNLASILIHSGRFNAAIRDKRLGLA